MWHTIYFEKSQISLHVLFYYWFHCFYMNDGQRCAVKGCGNSVKLLYISNLLPAELPRVIHIGTSLDVAFVWIIDSGGASVGSSQDEYEAV